MAIPENTYFDALIKADNNLNFFKSDLGLKLISANLEYKIDYTQQKLSKDMKEMYFPEEEFTLLAHLLYRIGYIRFKRPLKINANITSGSEAQLAEGTRFTDGQDIYYLDEFAKFDANETREVTLTNSKQYVKEYTVTDAILYYKIPTNVTYKDLQSVEIKRNGISLKYSQLFVKYDSEYSYEIQSDGFVYVVILLGNTNGLNIQLEDVLTAKIITAPDTVEVPNNLSIIENGYDLAIPEISLNQSYSAPMTIDDMKEMVQFGRKSRGDIVLNEDYRQFILIGVGGIKEVRVWQEREETEEVGYKIENINKLFVSYIGEIDNVSLDNEIINTIQDNIYGKPVTIKEAIIVPINVSILLKSNESISSATTQKIKDEIKGYYDDVHRVLDESRIYASVFKVVSTDINDFLINVSITNKGNFKNRNFFEILASNISINIESL